MPPLLPSLICVPGEDDREFWKWGADESWTKTGNQSGGRDCLVVIEALALDSIPLWAVAPEQGETDTRRVAAFRWEAYGAENASDRSWLHWEVAVLDGRTLVGSAGLVPEMPTSDWMKWSPKAFELSVRIWPLPPNELVVWKELGRYVVAFLLGPHLLHFASLSARHLGKAAAVEIRNLAFSLEAHEYPLSLQGARVWTACEPEFEEELQSSFGMAVVLEEKPAPILPPPPFRLCPPQVERLWQQQAAGRRRRFMMGALGALYLFSFLVWAGWLVWQEKTLDILQARIHEIRPQVDDVRSAQEGWFAVEEAVNPDIYPAEVFHRIVALLPPEGIRLKEFSLDRGKAALSGEASTVAHAKKFQSDVTESEGLKQFTWNFPQPTILDDNRASFRAEGLAGGGHPHEAE